MSAFGCVFAKAFPVAFGDTSSCYAVITTPSIQGGRTRGFVRDSQRRRVTMEIEREDKELLEIARALLNIL